MFVKNFLLVLLCGVAVLSFGTQSHANVLDFENFNYADGSLVVVSSSKWENHSGALFGMQVVGGQAVVQEDGSGGGEDAHISFAASSGDVYFGLDFTVTGTPPFAGTDTEYFAHFKDTGFNFSARFDVVAPTGGGDFSVGIASDDSTADAIWPTDLTLGTTYRAVVRYNQDDNIAELWINASVPGDSSILGDDKPDPGDVVTQFALRQSFSDYQETVRVDNIVIGTTFADVLVPVPEPASLLLILAGLAGLATRRRL